MAIQARSANRVAQQSIVQLQQAETKVAEERDAQKKLSVELSVRNTELLKQKEEQRRLRYVSDMNLVQAAFEGGNTSRAQSLLDTHRPEPGQPDLRGFEWRYWQRQLHREVKSIDAPKNIVERWIFPIFSHNASYLAWFDETAHQLVVTDTKTGTSIWTIPFKGKRVSMSQVQVLFDTVGKHVAVDVVRPKEDDSRVHEHEITVRFTATGEIVRTHTVTTPNPNPPEMVSIVGARSLRNNDGFVLCVVDEKAQRTIRHWNFETGQTTTICALPDSVHWISSLSENQSLYTTHAIGSGAVRGPIQIFKASSSEPTIVGEGSMEQFSPDGNRLVYSHGEGVSIYDIESRSIIATMSKERSGLARFKVFSSDGRWLLLGGGLEVPNLLLVDMRTLHAQPVAIRDTCRVIASAFSDDNQHVITLNEQLVIKYWKLDEFVKIEASPNPSLNSIVARSSDGQLLAMTAESKLADSSELGATRGNYAANSFRVYDSANQLLREFPKMSGPIHELNFSGDGKRIVAAALNSSNKQQSDIRVFDIETGQVLRSIVVPTTVGRSYPKGDPLPPPVALDADGRRLATVMYNPFEERKSSLRVFEVDSDRAPIDGGSVANYRLTGIAWSPDQQRIVANTSSSPAVWDAATGKLLNEFPLIHSSAFTNDGEWFCTMSGHTQELRIFEASTGRPIHTIPIESSYRYGLSDPSLKLFAVSPDKRKVAVAQLNREDNRLWMLPIVIYELAAPDKPMRVLEDEQAIGCSLEFTPDGRRIAVSLGHRIGHDEFLTIDAFTGDVLLRQRARSSLIRFAGDTILAFSRDRENRHGAEFSVIDASPLSPHQEAYLAATAIKTRNKNRPVMLPSEWNSWLEADSLLSKEVRELANQRMLQEFDRQQAYQYLWSQLSQAATSADLSRAAESLEELCRHDAKNVVPQRALTLARVRQQDQAAAQQALGHLQKLMNEAKLKPVAEDVAVEYLVASMSSEGPVAASKLDELCVLPCRDEDQFAALLAQLETRLQPSELTQLREKWNGRKIMPRVGRYFAGYQGVDNWPFTVTRVQGDQLFCGKVSIHRHYIVPLEIAVEYYTRQAELFPDAFLAYALRARAHQALKAFENAEKDFLQAIKLSTQMERETEQIALSKFYQARGDFSRQLEVLDQAVEDAKAYLANEPGPLLNYRAWLVATCPKDEVRNGRQALQDAEQACTWARWNDPAYLDTLAAAQAECGEFAEAIKWQTKAISLLDKDTDRAGYESRLKLYEAGKPYRENLP